MTKRVLIINPFGVGDVLFSTPLISAVKRKNPGWSIGYICNVRTREILETNPEVEDIFVFERDEYRKLWRKSKIACVRKIFNFWYNIGRKKFDITIDLSLGKEYAFLCWLAGIKERIGFNYKGRGRFLTYKIPFDGFNDKPVVEYYLDLVGGIEKVRLDTVLVPAQKDEVYIDNFLKRKGIKEKDVLVGIVPGGGISFGKENQGRRRWGAEKFAGLGDKIVEGFKDKIILIWGPEEEELIKKIASLMKQKPLIAPETSIREMAALCKRCSIVICSEGGPLHIASSQGARTISIFGPVDEKVYGPYPYSEDNAVITSDLKCRPCYKRFKLPECSTKKCLEKISVDTVFQCFRGKFLKGGIMKVDVFSLRKQYEYIKDEIKGPLEKVLTSGAFILGEDVGCFEQEFAKYCGMKYGVGVNSGTDALFLACLACGIGRGDEVIVMPYTYIATTLAISMTGARPVFVDIDAQTYNIDTSNIEKAITEKTKAILPVHLYGHPVDMDPLMQIVQKYNLKVIEDCAQAHGALYKNKKIGCFGDVSCFSFYPTKNLGCFGDGGIVLTDKGEIMDRLLFLRDYGRKGRYEHILKGYNSRLDTLQAAILRVKLRHLDEWNEKRRENARLYTELFKEKNLDVILPYEADYAKHVYHLYVIRVKKREKIMEGLKDAGVRTLIHYPIPIHLQGAYKELGYKKGDFPVSEKCCEEILSLPMYPELSKEEIRYVVEAISGVL